MSSVSYAHKPLTPLRRAMARFSLSENAKYVKLALGLWIGFGIPWWQPIVGVGLVLGFALAAVIHYSGWTGRRTAIAATVAVGARGEKIQATVSAGLASYPEDGEDVSGLFAMADDRMFQAKRAGRNRVVGAAEQSVRVS